MWKPRETITLVQKGRLLLAVALVAAYACGCMAPATLPVSEITFLYTSNTRAYTEPCGCCSQQSGGLPIRANYLAEYRASFEGESGGQGTAASFDESVLVLDAGGFSDNSSELKKIQSRYTVQAMEIMGYAAVNLGQSEMAVGQELLAEVLSGFSSTKVVSANWVFSVPKDAPDFSKNLKARVKPYIRKRVGEFSVFITGVSTTAPLQHMSPEASGISVEPIGTSLAEIFLSARHGELVVVLVNNLDQAEKAEVDAALESMVEEKNCAGVIVGHGEIKDKKPFPGMTGRDTDVPFVTLLNPLDRGRGVNHAVVKTAEAGTISKTSAGFEKLHKTQPKDEVISALMDKMALEATENDRLLHAKQAGEPGFENLKYIGSRVCRRCHMDEFKDHAASKHYNAYETLRHNGERNNAMCLPCHTVGYGEAGGFLLEIFENPALKGVGCESCHGAGTYHRKMQYGQPDGEPPPGTNQFGFLEVTEQTCLKCHTDETDFEWDYLNKLPLVNHSGKADEGEALMQN